MPIKYFSDAGFKGRGTTEDDPMSPAFVEPRKRTKNAEARWWCLTRKQYLKNQFAETTRENVLDNN